MGCYYFDAQSINPNEIEGLPAEFAFHSPFPNPFNPTTTFSFDLPTSSQVRLDVFDISGRIVGAHSRAPLQYTPGTHHITLNASDLSSGVYVYRFEAGEFVGTGKMLLLK